jgi:moderate conductance mechanosensitive channel
MLNWLSQAIADGLLRVILPLLLLVALTALALRVVTLAANAVDRRLIAPVDDRDRQARLQTLRKAATSTAQVVIVAIAVLIGMGTIGIDIGPALTAAGILGLAVSLGAQTLIKDIIGGLTILLEDEYRVGDAIRIGAVSGEVEHITLRRTDVRDAEGRLFMVPNGDVRVVANETRDWARALVELNFSFEADINKAVAALDEALMKVAADPRVKPHLLAAPEIFGWNAFNDWAVVVRMRARVTAGKQGEVARVMRQYALEALNQAGVPVASPHRLMVQPAEASGAALGGSAQAS